MPKSWESLFKPHILERGEDYFLEHRVRELERTADGWSALVEGSEDYEVEIYLDGDKVDDMYCDCPYAEEGNNCKHMAAVLYAIEAGGSETAEQWPVSPEELAGLIPESRLRPLLAELMTDNAELYRRLMLQYGNISSEDGLKVLGRDFDEICDKYLGKDGYVNYREAYYFADDTAELIRTQTDYLLEKGEPLAALDEAINILQPFSSCDSDDSDGGYGLVVSAVMDTCKLVLERSGEDELDKVFDSLRGVLERPGTHWFVRDLVKEIIFPDSEASEFDNIKFRRKKLELLDSQIDALERKQRGGGIVSEYELTWLLNRRFKMMEKLSLTEAERSAFLDKYIRFPDIRMLRVEQYLKTGDTDAAVRLLREGKLADGDKPGLVKDYSRKLIGLYRRTGRKDELLFELEYMVFELRGDMDDLRALKGECSPEQWLEYRERYLSGRGYHRLELMVDERLWERLLEAVTSSGSLMILDSYEKYLRELYPDELLQSYSALLDKAAGQVSDRKGYQWLAPYLGKLCDYPKGVEEAERLAADWRVRYKKRRAMMEELKNVGF